MVPGPSATLSMAMLMEGRLGGRVIMAISGPRKWRLGILRKNLERGGEVGLGGKLKPAAGWRCKQSFRSKTRVKCNHWSKEGEIRED